MNFERNKDPKESLKIGLYQVRHFKDDFEAMNWILPKLKTIQKLDGSGLTRREKLGEYIKKYIIVDDGICLFPGVPDPSLMWLIEHTLNKMEKK